METNEVVQTLSSISIGQIVSWVVVISGIISTIIGVTIKLYKVFEKAHKVTEEQSDFRELVKSHDEQLKLISKQISDLQVSIDEHNKDELARQRYSICRAGEEYVANGSLTIRQLRSLEDMYESYHEKHGNGYVSTLMRKVRALPVIGALDENEDDIIEEE